MTSYRDWLKILPGVPVFVAYPVGFDFTFVYWYLHRFAGESPFSHSALDIKTLAMALLGKGYRESGKRSWPRRWSQTNAHTLTSHSTMLSNRAPSSAECLRK
jgi:hypothetical protein